MQSLQDVHQPITRRASFRLYQELNDFLPSQQRGKAFDYVFYGRPSVKDTVEAIGVPHPEIDLILVDDKSVSFDYPMRGGERVAVYPVFERFDISPLLHLRPEPMRVTKFILDVHLGKLARYLRLFGFDTLYRNDLEDPEIIEISLNENRIILTRDLGILKTGLVTHGYWVRSTKPKQQLREVVSALQLENSFLPFSRCAGCNGQLIAVDKDSIKGQVDEPIWNYFNQFARCTGCHKLYWKGSHYDRIYELINSIQGKVGSDFK